VNAWRWRRAARRASRRPRALVTSARAPLAGALAQWTAFNAACTMFWPTETEAQQRLARRRAGSGRGEPNATARSRWAQRLQRVDAASVVPARLRSHSTSERHLLVCWRDSGRLARGRDPVVEFGDARESLRCQALRPGTDAGHRVPGSGCNWFAQARAASASR